MPVGPYETFAQCVAAQRKKGHSEDSARKICGKIEKNTKESVVRLCERTFLDAPPNVDSDAGVLRGVKLLGLTSRNGRKYEAKALEKATGLYEGRKVYVDHPHPGDEANDRAFSDWAGVIENVEYRTGDGLYGDVALRKQSPHFKGIIEAATHPKFHKSCGFSHIAEGESRFDEDTEIVESIREVFSVDLVTDPATTVGFFESVRKPAIKGELKKVAESLPEGPQRTKLIEMVDAYGLPPESDAAEKPTDPLTEFSAIAKELIRMLGEALVAKNTAPPPAPPATPVDPDKEEDEEMSPEDKQKLEAFESTQRENRELKAAKMLLESRRESTPARMKALANCETDDEREELLESWPRIEESQRPSSSPPALGSLTDFPRDNPERFAALLR